MDQDDRPEWDYKPSGSTAVAEPHAQPNVGGGAAEPPDSRSTMRWTASEYIEHNRGVGWYLLLVLATAAVAAIAYLVTRDYFAIGVITVLGIIVGTSAGRKPKEIQYELTSDGIHVGQKFYKYSVFRSFSIIHQEGLSSVEFTPLKKLMLPVAAYFGPGDEERVMDIIGQHLPYEERKMDSIDRLSRKLRF